MKRFAQMVALLVIAGVLMSGVWVVRAAETEKVFLEEKVILNESFENGIQFHPYNNREPGTWERFTNVDSASEDMVYITEEHTARIKRAAGAYATGLVYRYEPQETDVIIQFRARRVSTGGNMMLQLYYNDAERYRYNGGVGGAAWGGNVWNTILVHISSGQNISFYGKVDGASSFTKFSSSALTGAYNGGKDEEWNQIKFFIDTDKAGTEVEFEVDDVQITTYVPSEDGIYFSEDFENVSTVAELAERGVCASHVSGNISMDQADGNTAVRITGQGSTPVVQIDSGCKINNFQLPAVMPEEFYASFRIKNESVDQGSFCAQLFFNGTLPGGVTSNKREVAARRVWLHGSSTTLAMTVDENGTNKTVTVDGYTFPSGADSEWVTVVFHVVEEQFEVYVKSESDEKFTKIMDMSKAASYNLNGTVNHDVNQFKVYTETSAGSFLVDDIQIYEPGMRSTGAVISAGAEGGLTAEMGIVGNVGKEQPLMGIFALYDDQEMMKAVAITETTLDGVMGGSGKITAVIDQIPEGATNAKFYLWDEMESLQPLAHWIDFSALNE